MLGGNIMEILFPENLDALKDNGIDIKQRMLSLYISYSKDGEDYEGYLILKNDKRPLSDDALNRVIADAATAMENAGVDSVSVGCYQEFIKEKELTFFLNYNGSPTHVVLLAKLPTE